MPKDLNFYSVGRSVLVSRKEQLQQQIRLMITTSCASPDDGIYGEKYGVPEYGCNAAIQLWNFLATRDVAALTNAIYNALQLIEDIQVFYNDIDLDIDAVNQNVSVTIYYKDLQTNEKAKVVINK